MSTSNKPVLFFQSFFEKNNFKKFVNDFFTYNDNPTFFPNLDAGYIEFIDSIYFEGEDSNKPRKKYFKDYLLKILVPQKTISIRLIADKIEDIINSGNSPDKYIFNIRENLTKLKSHIIISQNQYSDLILPLLDEIIDVLKIPKSQPPVSVKQLQTIKSYFRPTINTVKLRKVYVLARILEILDIETTSENDFINVFLSSNPTFIHNQIIFKTNNRRGVFFITCMFKYFENLKPSTIDHSQSFFSKAKKNKESTLLKQGTINNVITYIKYNSKNNFSDIIEAFENLDKEKN